MTRLASSPHPLRETRTTARDWYARRRDRDERRRRLDQLAAAEGLTRDDDHLLAPPAWILRVQPFPRIDFFVRILAIEEFTGRNRIGAALYEKFMLPSPSDRRSAAAFAVLFDGIVRDGLDPAHPLILHPQHILGNGWHRLACAAFLGVPRVRLHPVSRSREPWSYTVETLRERGFTAREIGFVLETERRVLADLGLGTSDTRHPSDWSGTNPGTGRPSGNDSALDRF